RIQQGVWAVLNVCDTDSSRTWRSSENVRGGSRQYSIARVKRLCSCNLHCAGHDYITMAAGHKYFRLVAALRGDHALAAAYTKGRRFLPARLALSPRSGLPAMLPTAPGSAPR